MVGVMTHEFSECVCLDGDVARQVVLGLGGAGLDGGYSIAYFLRQVILPKIAASPDIQRIRALHSSVSPVLDSVAQIDTQMDTTMHSIPSPRSITRVSPEGRSPGTIPP
jgi:hypothetical protein